MFDLCKWLAGQDKMTCTTHIALQSVLVRADLVHGTSNGIACLLSLVLGPTDGVLGALLDLLVVDSLLVLKCFALTAGTLPCQSLLLQRILVGGLCPHATVFLGILLFLYLLWVAVTCDQTLS